MLMSVLMCNFVNIPYILTNSNFPAVLVQCLQCSGSITFLYGSADPYHCMTEPDPALFSVALKIPTKNKFSFQIFFAYYLRYIYISLQKRKSNSEVTIL
jgi:hypothetical protein